MPEDRKGLLDEMDEMAERRKKRKAKPKETGDDLDLDGVW